MDKREKRLNIGIPLLAIAMSLVVGAVVMLCLGKNPLQAYWSLLQGCGLAPKASYAGHKGMITDFTSFLNYLTPMIFAALAVAVALRAGLFNIGVSGQMLAAGFLASITVGYSSLHWAVAKPLVILIGIAAGALLGALVGWLKYQFNINEVVSTIMLNYIIQYVVSFFINMKFVDPVSRQSKVISDNSRLILADRVIGDYKIDLPVGFFLALIVVFLVKFLFDKTVAGFEMRAVGSNRKAAEYAGIKVGKNLVLSMTISGALAGLAGVTYYLGYFASIQPRTLSSTGFDAIAVSLLGANNPVGIIFSSVLISIISKGSTYMSSASGIVAEITGVISGIILLFSACSGYMKEKIIRRKEGR